MDKYRFEVESADIVESPEGSQFATAVIRAFNTGRSLHNTLCDVDTLKKTASTIYEKPIIWEYDSKLGDFGTHNAVTTVPAGFVVPGSAKFIELEDGRVSLSIFAKIWKRYSGKFLEIFRNTNTTNKGVSVEMEVNDYEKTSDGLINLKDFAYSAICVLGDYVTEASPGAQMEMVTFATQERSKYGEAFLAEFSGKYDGIDFTIPVAVKNASQTALDKHKGSGSKGATSVALATARFIIKSDVITPEKVRIISKFFKNRNEFESVSAELFGGRDGAKWAGEINAKLDEIDSKRIAYYANLDESEKNNKKEITMTDEKEKEGVLEIKNAVKPEEETPPAEKKEEKKEEEKPDEKKGEGEKFSLGESFDYSGLKAFLLAEQDVYADEVPMCKMAAEEVDKGDGFCNYSVVMSALYAKMCKMASRMAKMTEDSKAYMAENEELKKFKAGEEEKQKMFSVEETLAELSKRVVIPEDAMNEMRTEAANFSLEKLDAWKNYCKAKSFDFAVKEEGEAVKRIGLPFGQRLPRPSNDIWAGTKKE